MLDLEEESAVVGVHDGLQAPLVLAGLPRDEPAVEQATVRPREVGDVDGDVVAVPGGLRLGRLPEHEGLDAAHPHPGRHPGAVVADARGRTHEGRVEPRHPGRVARRHREFHVRHAQDHIAELGGGRVAAKTVAPRAGHHDGLPLDLVGEPRPPERGADGVEPLRQLARVGHDEAGHPAQHLGLAGRQVELLPADVHPHVVHAHHEVGVAGEAHAHDPEDGGELLIGHPHVDVLERHDVAHVLPAAVVGVRRHDPRPSSRRGLYH